MNIRILERAWKAPNDRDDSKETTDYGQKEDGNEMTQEDKHNSQKPQGPNSFDLNKLLNSFKSFFGGSGSSTGSPKGMGLIGAIIAGVILLFWLATGFYTVDAGQKGVELFLGKYSKIKDPGLTWRWPSPVGEHRIIDIQRRFSQKIGGVTAGGRRNSVMLTKDENIVDVRVEVQYQIDNFDPQKYWFASVSPDETLKQVVDSATRERVGQTLLDDILTEGREQLMQEVKELAQSIVNNYGIGLVITNMNLEDAQAPLEVQDAFSDAIRAREDEQSRINQSLAYKSKVEEEARGEAAREIEEAEAYRERKIAEARGEADRFAQLLSAYQKAPEVTRKRLYLETMEEVLESTHKIILGEQNQNNLMMLPLERLFGLQSTSQKETLRASLEKEMSTSSIIREQGSGTRATIPNATSSTNTSNANTNANINRTDQNTIRNRSRTRP